MTNQPRRWIKKGFHIYVFQVGYTKEWNKMTSLENILVIQDFMDVFIESIPGLPPRCDIDFTIELIPGATPVSKFPYRISIPELVELKI